MELLELGRSPHPPARSAGAPRHLGPSRQGQPWAHAVTPSEQGPVFTAQWPCPAATCLISWETATDRDVLQRGSTAPGPEPAACKWRTWEPCVSRPCCMLCVVRGGRALRHAVCCSALCVITCCAACQAVLWHDAGWHKVPTHPSLNSLPGPQTKVLPVRPHCPAPTPSPA